MDGETLVVRDNETYFEYARVIDSDLCDQSHPVFRYPAAIQIITSLVASGSGYTIIGDAKMKELIVTLTISLTPAPGIKIEDNLVVSCVVNDYDATATAIARLESRVTKLQDERKIDQRRFEELALLTASLAHRLHISEMLEANERTFGRIPAALIPFARAILESGEGPQMFRCLATIVTYPRIDHTAHGLEIHIDMRAKIGSTVLRPETCISARDSGGSRTISMFLSTEFVTSLLWIPSVVVYLNCESYRLERIIPRISAIRLIIGGLTITPTNYLPAVIELHPDVRSVAIMTAPDTKSMWEFLKPIVTRCELILPENMRAGCPYPTGANIMYFNTAPTMQDLVFNFHPNSIERELKMEDSRASDIARFVQQ